MSTYIIRAHFFNSDMRVSCTILSMKKVLFVATVVKKHIMQFHIPYLKMLKEMGFETSVAAANDYENPADCVIPWCDNYYNIPIERSPLNFRNIEAYRQLKTLIDENHYDLIHCHTPVGAFLARMAARDARKTGTKVIYTAHGFHFFSGAPVQNWMIYYPVEKFASRFTDALITINQEDYIRALKFHAKRVYYVPGVGIDMNRFSSRTSDKQSLRKQLNLDQDCFLLLSVGELNQNKNHISVIRALHEINYPNIQYVICGEGPDDIKLKEQVHAFGLDNQVIFTGYTKQVKDYYQAADLFVFPSYREGLSLSLMEAISAHLPVLCSDIRGNRDLVQNADCRFQPGDQNELTEKLRKMLNQDNTSEAEKNYNNLSKYALNPVLEQVKKIYEDCLR